MLSILNLSCFGFGGIKHFVFGKTEVERTVDENGRLIFYKKINRKSRRPISHPHNPVVVKTKTKKFSDNKLVEKSIHKIIFTSTDWEGKTLKFKRTFWTAKGDKVKEKD